MRSCTTWHGAPRICLRGGALLKHRPFLTESPKRRSVQAAAADRVDYKPSVAFLFPGQGAQKDVVETVPAARALFDRAAEVLGYDLLKLCVEGPKAELDSTRVSQPALYVAGLAAVEKLRAEQGEDAVAQCDVTAGLSLGEYTALTFAGAMTFEDGLKLVKRRGEVMQAAADLNDTGMVSVIGLKSEQAEALCAEASSRAGEGEHIQIANYLCPGNYAVSGSSAALKILQEIAKPEFKARLTVPLAVAGAFHSPYMQSAAESLTEPLEEIRIQTPSTTFVSSVDGEAHSDPERIRELLASQVTAPVKWEHAIKNMIERGLHQSYELGPGTVLAGIMKRIDKKHPIENIEV